MSIWLQATATPSVPSNVSNCPSAGTFEKLQFWHPYCCTPRLCNRIRDAGSDSDLRPLRRYRRCWSRGGAARRRSDRGDRASERGRSPRARNACGVYLATYARYWRINLLTMLEYRANFIMWAMFTVISFSGKRRASVRSHGGVLTGNSLFRLCGRKLASGIRTLTALLRKTPRHEFLR